MLETIFAERSIVNDNAPIHLCNVGEYFAVQMLPPVVAAYIQIVVILLLQIAVSVILSIVMYYGILHSQSRAMSCLIAFGVVIPVALVIPFCWIEWWDIRSRALRMGLVCLPSIMTFRCLECLFGFTPAWVLVGTKNASRSGSLWLYVQRNGFILWPKLDSSGNRLLPASLDSMWTEIKGYLLNLVIGAMAHSFMAPFNYAPFLSGQEATGIFVTYSIFQLGNNFLTAVLVGHSLSLSMNGISLLMQTIGGCQTEAVTNQPLFASKSPSDFWSNRWNKLIHTGIKQGVYKPVRFYSGSNDLAVLVSFAVSGLFHEYVWLLMFRCNSHEDENVPRLLRFGKSMLFFGWNGSLVLMEYAIGRERWENFVRKYPKPLVTFAVVMMVLPVSHLFTGDMVAGGYFAHVKLYFPLFQIVQLRH